MNDAILWTSIAGIIVSVLTAYFTWKDAKSFIFVCAAFTGLISMVILVLQKVSADRNEQEVAKLNAQLLEASDKLFDYTSGGKGNKPIMIASFSKREEGGFDVVFGLKNFGSFPIQGVTYVLHDSYSISDAFMKEHGYKSLGQAVNAEPIEINRHAQAHQAKANVTGNLANLPKGTMMRIHAGTVPKGLPATMYNLTVAWNNQAYMATYQYILNEDTGESKLYQLNVRDDSDKEVEDLAVFFPLVPKEAWGDLPTKVQKGRLTQFDARKTGEDSIIK